MIQDATAFIPHQAPMVFVDTVSEFGEDYVMTQLTIRPELMFCETEGLPSWAAIEIMAQTVSVFAGRHGQQGGEAPKIGYLLGTRKMQLPVSHFALGSTLTIRAQQSYLHEGLGQFQCELHYEQHCISAVLSVYQPNEQPQLGK